jgi:adsorption protein B
VWTAYLLAALAVWVLLSGLDDLFISLVWICTSRRRLPRPSAAELAGIPERRMAILLPLWHEHSVIGSMLERNLAAIRYRNYDIFAGVYPNDDLTIQAVAEAARNHPRLHLAMAPNNGPTSKGDCLNAIHRYLVRYEARHYVRFETLITHDAEDLIHPESLALINWYGREYHMVQIPVLALPTRSRELTHGLYCDEFAEYQSKDIPVRQILGGFLPSNGVGTGFDRAALEHLASTRGGQLFDPDCLTEDYENGYGLHALGYRQVFVPIAFRDGAPVATREYFPRTLRPAIRQRSRWVTGIALQGWQRHGWSVPVGQIYWFWRDRKGLIGNLVSPLANILFLLGLEQWHRGLVLPPALVRVCGVTVALSVFQAATRAWCSARIYGWRFAALVIPRILWSNVVNGAATFSAVRQYAAARWAGRSPAWRKTDHIYPVHRTPGQAQVGELLVRMNSLSRGDLDVALMTLPRHQRLGEHLLGLKKVTEEDLYRALSLQAGLEFGPPRPEEVSRAVTQTFPAAIVRRWRVLPYRVHLGHLHVATCELPCEEMTRDLAHHAGLEFRFRLLRPADFERLRDEYLAATTVA